MPEDVFWRGPITAFESYEHAHTVRKREQNEFAWLQGLYFFRALNSTPSLFGGKPKVRYPNKPIKLEGRTPEEETRHQNAVEMIRQHNMVIRAKLSGLR